MVTDLVQEVLKISKARHIPGYFPGMPQAVFAVSIDCDWSKLQQSSLAYSHAYFAELLPSYLEQYAKLSALQDIPLRQIFAVCLAMLHQAGYPTIDTVRQELRLNPTIPSIKGSARLTKTFVMPALSMGQIAHQFALEWAAKNFNQWQSGQLSQDRHADAYPQIKANLSAVIKRMEVHAPLGQNSLRFIQAAQQLNIPYVRVTANVFQFGWGRNARWLDSSFTDATPNISARLARNKVATSRFLRNMGIPVCQQLIVKSAEEAAEEAKKMGFPVVIKPSDQDGGRGVFVGLKNVEGVRQAFEEAKKLSSTILLEKQFIGQDYRIQVYQGQAYWAVHRIPGGVVGDGEHSIEELLVILNAHPLRGEPGSNALLKRIDINQEASDLLTEQELTLKSIPHLGQFVRLRQAANVASGGSIVPVLEFAHPDNIQLAERAARVMRLDLAGIDLLIPDIRHSWLESGAAICEVNAQPQMSPHLPLEILNKILVCRGRIPVVVVFGSITDSDWRSKVVEQYKQVFSDRNLKLGMIDASSCYLDAVPITAKGTDMYTSALALLSDPQTSALVIHFTDSQFLNSGIPVDQIESLILLPENNFSDPELRGRWLFRAQFLLDMCIQTVHTASELSGLLPELKFPPSVISKNMMTNFAELICSELKRQSEHHLNAAKT
ncbi:acetate--CoA ligase family protein [Undibacterium fentianense]|uniref:Acetate--CoA ligase family protein n=1 Tax=Undibacterium fentianense TaxID=2828728 RepID=A0A941E4I3_9BURK|nr:acetate--CoA ligase family protein [Undibacterium fentianense]MBR7801037.1 acetate--CoA ligase family protein [Undibacterium fentianense]